MHKIYDISGVGRDSASSARVVIQMVRWGNVADLGGRAIWMGISVSFLGCFFFLVWGLMMMMILLFISLLVFFFFFF